MANKHDNKKEEVAKRIAKESERFARGYEYLGENIIRLFRFFSIWIDKILFNQKYGKLVALGITLLLFFTTSINGNKGFTTAGSADIIKDIPVTVLVNDAVYEVSGLPEKVNATVIGELNDVQLVRSQGDYKVVADLSGLTEGVHEVELQAVDFSPRVDVILQPSTATIRIQKKVTQSFAVGYDFVNVDKMNRIYSLGTPEFEANDVLVRASQDTIDKIAFVKALINVKGVDASFEQQAPLVAYDQNGVKLDVDILPETIGVKVEVSEPKKDVSIVIEPIGTIPNGKAIESLTLEHQSVTLYGPQSILDTINDIKIQIPANNLTKDTELTMPIILPNGVAKTSVTKVNIKVKLADMAERTLEDIPITYINNDNGYVFSTTNPDDAYADVILKGAQSVIDTINPEDVEVFIDLKDISTGVQEIQLQVRGKNNLVIYETTKQTIELNVESK